MTQEQITDIKIGSNNVIKAMLNNEIVWPHVEKINTEDYMTIEILEDDSYISIRYNTCYDYDDKNDVYYSYSSVSGGYLYCINGDGIWISIYDNKYYPGTYVRTNEIFKAGDKVSFKKTMSSANKEIVPIFNVEKIESNEDVRATFNLSGNCMSLIYGDDAKNHNSLLEYPFVFSGMFSSPGTKVINVSPNFLPATTLSRRCYMEMFISCKSLTKAPELPATTLADGCYSYMFQSCTSLTEAPELPALTLQPYCYEYMFYGCSALSNSPVLPATTLVKRCYQKMFNACTNLTEITALFDSFGDTSLNATTDWVLAAGTFFGGGVFRMNRDANWNPEDHRGPSGVPQSWTVVYY